MICLKPNVSNSFSVSNRDNVHFLVYLQNKSKEMNHGKSFSNYLRIHLKDYRTMKVFKLNVQKLHVNYLATIISHAGMKLSVLQK